MALLNMPDFGMMGVNKDVQDFRLPLQFWSDAQNARFRDKSVVACGGAAAAFDVPVAPYWALHVFDAAQTSAWIVAGLEKVYTYTDSTATNITRQTAMADVNYSATAELTWNGGVLGGIPILNNGFDVPQQWAPIAAATKLEALANWDATWLCASIRPFKNFLIAMNITEDGTEYIHRVRTSTPAAPGAVPSSWDATDPVVDATRFDLSDVASGPLIDGAGLRDIFILGKRSATWGMQFVGGQQKWRVFSISEMSGLLAANCITPEPEGTFLFMATGEDIVICDGQQVRSLLTERMRRWLQVNIDTDNYKKSFCCTDTVNKECWFCFPMSGSTSPNMALVWGKQDNTLTFRSLDNYAFIAQGAVPSVGTDWDSLTGTWNDNTAPWSALRNRPYSLPLVGLRPAETDVQVVDVAGTANSGYLERTGLAFNGLSRDGVPTADMTQRKLVRRIWLQGRGGTVRVRLGSQAKIGSTVKWSGWRTVNLDSRVAVDFTQAGVLWALGIEFDAPFQLDGVVADVHNVGSYVV